MEEEEEVVVVVVGVWRSITGTKVAFWERCKRGAGKMAVGPEQCI